MSGTEVTRAAGDAETVAEGDPRQEALAAEHAAVWTYGVLAARTSRSAHPGMFKRFSEYHDAHEIARDRLLADLAEQPGGPARAAASYPLPARLRTPAELTAAAADVEAQGTQVYAWLVSRTAGALRANAITALEAGALRELKLRGTPQAFPGAPDLTTGS